MTHYTPDPVLFSFPDTSHLSSALAAFVIRAQNDALAKRDSFRLAISGGSLAQQLGALLGPEHEGKVKWEKWEIFLADERLVPLDHPDSNFALISSTLLSKIPEPGIPDEQIHTIDVDQLDNPEAVAEDYEQQLMGVFAGKNAVAFPRFDLVLLGMGPDGHTCSLFPGHPLLNEELLWVAWLDDSPKPPPARITLTFPVLNHAHRVAFVVAGEAKKEMLSRVFDRHAETSKNGQQVPATNGGELGSMEGPDIPCSRVKPIAPGHVYWFCDEVALKEVNNFPKTSFEAKLQDPKL